MMAVTAVLAVQQQTSLLAPSRLWLLLIVAVLAVGYLVAQRRRTRNTVRFTQIELLDQIAPKRPGWRRHIVASIQLAALVLGVVAAAQPVRRSLDRQQTDGRIIFLFDVSLSMEATDVEPNRLGAAQTAATSFVDQIAPTLEIGLVSFSGTVATEVSLTTDRIKIQDGIDGLQLGLGTAIGDALATGVRTLQKAAGDQADSGKAPGAIVLLTDGETTVGRPTAEGAALAVDANIPVYTIAFGTPDGEITDPDTGDIVPVPVKLDELQIVADTTGGQAFAAPSEQELRGAYNEISKKLDTSLGESNEIVQDLAWKFALAAAALLATAWVLSLWWLRGPI